MKFRYDFQAGRFLFPAVLMERSGHISAAIMIQTVIQTLTAYNVVSSFNAVLIAGDKMLIGRILVRWPEMIAATSLFVSPKSTNEGITGLPRE